ncbi:retrovirus-related pol polyprotein from transposon TNT 1-94 [Tanacetum coccineum]
MAPKRTTRARPALETTTTTTSVTNAQLWAMIDQGVTAALAARDATRNGDDSHTSGTGVRRTERVARECTYQDFLKCQPLYFTSTEGVVELTQWIVSQDVTYAMTWTDLRKKMTDKYCLRNEMKKLEVELWNLKVKESNKVERYVGGLPDMIQGSVVASKLKTMQEATEMASELMDKKINTIVERQAEKKWIAYTAGSGDNKVFNTRRQQTEETYHITFDESPDAIKISKPLINNINIAKNERYPPDKYLYPDKPSQMCQTNSNDVSFIEPYKCHEPVVLETEVSLDQNAPQENGSGQVHEPGYISLVILSGTAHQDMAAKELGTSLAHECLFIDFLSKEEPKKVSEALQHPGWVDSMQDELNQFAKNKFWILVHAPYSKTIIGSEWVFRNKRDETRIIIKNKVRLVAQGYNQQEGIDYDETFAPVIKQSERGISSNQEKYVKDLLKKYDINGSSVKTLMVPPNKLRPDLNGKAVNET